MNDEPDPAFDAVHPSGTILFRSCRGGLLHSVALAEQAMETDANSLAEGILRTATVSFMKSAMQIRAELIAGVPDHPPGADVPTPQDLDEALIALNSHTLAFKEQQ